MRSVVVIKPNGEAREFPKIKMAAEWLGCEQTSFSRALRLGLKLHGAVVAYTGKDMRGVNTTFKPRGEEFLSKDEADALVAESKQRGVRLEKVYYEKKFGAIFWMQCRKREKKEGKEFPLVGSVDCMQCCNFIGKNKKEGYVLCAYYGKKEDYTTKRSKKSTGVYPWRTLDEREK